MGGFIMSEQKKQYTNEEYLKIKEYLEKNYPPLEEDREEDELMQKMDELEDKLGYTLGNGKTTMSVMTNFPATERVFVTINEMAKILGIGHNSIRRLVRENPNADYIFWQGTRAYLKREMFINIILKQSTL
jgi:bisphosphoglycerate-dependent phosphoglycerate mutase